VKEAGIREARQNLTALIEEVRKGHEVTITDRGKPVARLVPPQAEPRRPFAGATEFRRRMPVLPLPLSTTIVDDRVDERAERV